MIKNDEVGLFYNWDRSRHTLAQHCDVAGKTMKLFTERVPWTEEQWWQAGKNDALACLTPRFDGSDTTKIEQSSYMRGYTNGREIGNRTAACPKFTPHKDWEIGHCYNVLPGLFPEEVKNTLKLISLAFFTIVTLGFLVGTAVVMLWFLLNLWRWL